MEPLPESWLTSISKNLILIDPKGKKSSLEAKKRAKHAEDVLKKAKIKKSTYLKQYDYLIATTAIIGTDYNIPRSPLTPEQLSLKLSKIKDKKIGILIGPEDKGLSNKDLREADFVVTIPTSKTYPTLNISHAVSILLYELSKSNAAESIKPVGKKEKDELLKIINKQITKMNFTTKEKKDTQRIIWKRILGKSFLTQREAFALFGFFRKLK